MRLLTKPPVATKSPVEKVAGMVDVKAVATTGLSALAVMGGVAAASAVVSAIRSKGAAS
jgi:hypothetical protein